MIAKPRPVFATGTSRLHTAADMMATRTHASSKVAPSALDDRLGRLRAGGANSFRSRPSWRKSVTAPLRFGRQSDPRQEVRNG
jgi:hypothetical protein